MSKEEVDLIGDDGEPAKFEVSQCPMLAKVFISRVSVNGTPIVKFFPGHKNGGPDGPAVLAMSAEAFEDLVNQIGI